MRRRLGLAVAMLCLAGAVSAHAHEIPPERVVIVQPEASGVAVLVAWKSPMGEAARLAQLQAAWGHDKEGARDALITQWVTRALAPVRFHLDGESMEMDDIDVKVVQDPPGSGRYGVAVLLTKKWEPGPHELSVLVQQTREQTKVQWTQRPEVNVRERGGVAAGAWVSSGRPLNLAWGNPDGGEKQP